MIQTLKGAQIIPRGKNNRFTSQNWPRSYAFGGWIYSANVSIGYSNNPTEIRISVVLETSTFDQSAAKFDISEFDLRCDAGNGGLDNETWFDIDLEGIIFENFLLYQYDFSVESNQKILNILFKDYSMILDKIYVGLFKKQGYIEEYTKTASCDIELPIKCQDCEYSGSAIIGEGNIKRDISFASYVGINGSIYDNFAGFYYGNGNVYKAWNSLIYNTEELIKSGILYNSRKKNPSAFDLNGGYLIIGTESVSEQNCNSSPNITYSFIELLSSLRRNGLKFLGAFPSGQKDSDFVYRTSHIGSLREVLQNWCSDLGYSFYCSGRNFVGLDLKKPIDISEITKVADPTSDLGKLFLNPDKTNTSILSLKSSFSLENTFKQSVIVENSHPITENNTSKNIKRYVGILPLHPVSLNLYSNEEIIDYNIYGREFERSRYETPIYDDQAILSNFTYESPAYSNFQLLDGRSYYDLDTAIALSNYNDTLRDIFVAQKALYNLYVVGRETPLTNPYCMANFNALGMFPILEITNQEFVADILTDYFSNSEKDGVANLNMEAKYFRVFIGYYYEDVKKDIVAWEKKAAESMYKYGLVTNGPLQYPPFVAPDVLDDISPEAGFYGKNGLVYSRIKNNFSPSTDRYASVKNTPFVDVLIQKGLVKSNSQGEFYQNNPNFPAYVPPGFSISSLRIPTGLWISTLENDWGTTREDFEKAFSLNFVDECASKFSLDQSVKQILTDSDRHAQDWNLSFFSPIANGNLEKIDDIIQANKYIFETLPDNVISIYSDNNWENKNVCQKLHVLIIPDTTTHPNLNVSFVSNAKNRVNPVVLEKFKQKFLAKEQEKNVTKTPSICSYGVLEEACENALNLNGPSIFKFKNADGSKAKETQFGCVLYENKENYFFEGFQEDVVFNVNSRSLDIFIEKNPGARNGQAGLASDENGDYYYTDLEAGFLEIKSHSANLEIIYPVQGYEGGYANYYGILSTDVSNDIRLPSLTEIHGEPINQKNNNVSSFKIINNTTDSSLNPKLNPFNNEVVSYMTVITGEGNKNIITTPGQYYEYIKNLNNYNLETPMKTLDLTLAGPPNQFGKFLEYLNPSYGLHQISFSISDNGVRTNLSFSDRPKSLPKQEAILNKIGPRIKGTYN
jgi:hypothetical protein